jgi:magnesium transporter
MFKNDNSIKYDNAKYYDDNREQIERAIFDALENERIHEARKLAIDLHIADLADLVDRASTEQRVKLIEILGDAIKPELLVELDRFVRAKVIFILGYNKIGNLISALDTDDAVYALEDLDEEIQSNILLCVSKERNKDLTELLSYPENSAGRLMRKKFISVPDYWNVGQALDYIKKRKNVPQNFYEIFVVDPKFHPIGEVQLSALIQHERDTIIKDIMNNKLKVINTELDQEQVSFLFSQYRLVSVPVVNKTNSRIVGVITIEDAVDIIEEEAEEDIMHLGGVHETDIHLPVIDTVKKRLPWLLINLMTASMSVYLISLFENTIGNIVILAALMPLVANISGNAGTQTMTVSIVSITSKELTSINALRVILKQILACTLNGLLLGLVGGVAIMFWQHNLFLSIVFSLSIIINFALAGFFGSSFPIFLHKIGVDPAIASSIFLTTMTDMFGFFIFLGLASILF